MGNKVSEFANIEVCQSSSASPGAGEECQSFDLACLFLHPGELAIGILPQTPPPGQLSLSLPRDWLGLLFYPGLSSFIPQKALPCSLKSGE